MKVIVTSFLLFTSIYCFSQKPAKLTHPYALLSGGVYKFDKQDATYQYGCSVGGTFNLISFGVGLKYTKFKADKNAYIPVYVEFIAAPQTTVAPVIIARLGYGNYENKVKAGNTTVTTNGGLYLEFQIGVALGKPPHQIVLSIGYARATFQTIIGSTNSHTDTGGLSATVGLKI